MPDINPLIIEQLGRRNTPAAGDTADQIDPSKHSIFDESKRKKKKVIKPVLGSDGKPTLDENNKPITQTDYIDPARLSLSMQDIIVTRRVAFMNLGKARIYAEPNGTDEERAFSLLQQLRDNNKVSFKESEIATIVNKELQVAKLWYSTEAVDASHWGGFSNVKKDFNVQILAPSKGDSLLPIFDGRGKLVYFGRGYSRTPDIVELMSSGADLSEAEKKIECLDVYSSTNLYRFEKGDDVKGSEAEGGWTHVGTVPLPYGKMPIIYYSKDTPIWKNVQPLIERLETAMSDFADANSYNSSPLLAFLNVKDAKGFEKGEAGKVAQLNGDHADAKYVTWDQVIDAVKYEIDTLVNFIYSLTQTPNISFEEMKGLGDLSGVAFDRVFLDAHLAASKEIEGGYGELLQRSVNLEKALLASMDTSIKTAMQSLSVSIEVPRFKLDDAEADVTLASSAYSGGLISQETAIGMSGLVSNAQEELERIGKGTKPVEI